MISDLVPWSVPVEEILDVKPWKPEILDHSNWPPNYSGVYKWRQLQLQRFKKKPYMIIGAKQYYKNRPIEFILHWVDTYDPRRKGEKWVPFILFKRQAEFVDFYMSCVEAQESGLVEKCRDAGVTWLVCALSVHAWLNRDNTSIGWGSRKQELVDRLGNPDSIFEKMRLIVRRLPKCFRPIGYDVRSHATFMKMVNPENGSIIAGEAGDNIGRGGRTEVYNKDESSYYPRAESVEAALDHNTNVQMDISSVNGVGNIFHRKRSEGVDWSPGKPITKGFVNVFVFDWRDHPAKTDDWYNTKRAKSEREGMLHIFAQEVERNYSSALQNNVIPMNWLTHCVDAHKCIDWLTPDMISNRWSAGLDVAGDDSGTNDRNALAKTQGIVLRSAREWGERDPGVSTRNVIAECSEHKGIIVQYDSIGVGEAVKSEFNRLVEEKIIDTRNIRLMPWNAAAEVQNKYAHLIPDDIDSPMNKDFFENMKAQAWWSLRTRIYKTFKAVTEGVRYSADELFSIDSTIPLKHQLMEELAQAQITRSTKSLKIVVDKSPNGSRSPNIADAIVMAMFPVLEVRGVAQQGTWGNN